MEENKEYNFKSITTWIELNDYNKVDYSDPERF